MATINKIGFLYTLDQVLTLDPSTFVQTNDKIYSQFLNTAITIQNRKELIYLASSTKQMFAFTQKQLKKHPSLIKILQGKQQQQFIQKKIKEINPDLSFVRQYCNESICKYYQAQVEKQQIVSIDFENFIENKTLQWKLCMTLQTGIWNYSPFSKKAPAGIVTSLLEADIKKPQFYDNIVNGFLINDTFFNKNAKISRSCILNKNPPYNQKKTFKDKAGDLLATCRNKNLTLLYNKKLKQPYLTSTFFISYVNSNKYQNDFLFYHPWR